MNETLKEITVPTQASFEDAYAELRAREGRVYSDEELLRLPEVPDHHPLAGEWKLRRQSTNRLLKKILDAAFNLAPVVFAYAASGRA